MRRTYKEVILNNYYAGKTAATTGAISELRVGIDLLTKGYHVFRSESPNCPCDLVAIKNNKIFTIEVRTTYRNSSGTIPQSAYKERELGIVNCFAFVFKDANMDILYHTPDGIQIGM